MYPISRKRVNLSLEEKLWIIRKNQEHKKNSQTRLALDFSVKFKRPITRSCICKTLNKSEEILALATKNPELETKKAFKLQQLILGAVVKIYTVPTHKSDTFFALTKMSLFWGEEDFAKKYINLFKH